MQLACVSLLWRMRMFMSALTHAYVYMCSDACVYLHSWHAWVCSHARVYLYVLWRLRMFIYDACVCSYAYIYAVGMRESALTHAYVYIFIYVHINTCVCVCMCVCVCVGVYVCVCVCTYIFIYIICVAVGMRESDACAQQRPGATRVALPRRHAGQFIFFPSTKVQILTALLVQKCKYWRAAHPSSTPRRSIFLLYWYKSTYLLVQTSINVELRVSPFLHAKKK